jgi:hypothetical protein
MLVKIVKVAWLVYISIILQKPVKLALLVAYGVLIALLVLDAYQNIS